MFNLDNRGFTRLDAYGFKGIIPAQDVVAIVKNDDEDFEKGSCRAIWSGTDGTINFVTALGSVVEGFPIFAGMNQISANRILTGGTATDLWALY